MLPRVNWWSGGVEASPGASGRATVDGAVSWAARGTVAVTDQALLAGTNFLVNVFLARWMAPAPYGAFALALALSWLLRTANDAVLTGPLTVFGAGRHGDCFPSYLGAVLGCQLWVTLPLAGV